MMHLSAGVATNPVVMRGLDPRIHPLSKKRFFKGWIAGSSPAMTNCMFGETA
jgi:hypothetical protein